MKLGEALRAIPKAHPKDKFLVLWSSCLIASLPAAAAIQLGVSPQYVMPFAVVLMCLFLVSQGISRLPREAKRIEMLRTFIGNLCDRHAIAVHAPDALAIQALRVLRTHHLPEEEWMTALYSAYLPLRPNATLDEKTLLEPLIYTCSRFRWWRRYNRRRMHRAPYPVQLKINYELFFLRPFISHLYDPIYKIVIGLFPKLSARIAKMVHSWRYEEK